MQRVIAGTLFCWLCTLTAFAQTDSINTYQEERSAADFFQRVTVGGNFGLQFGRVTFIDISPTFGYRFTDRFTAGPGITYRYLKFRDLPGSSLYGGRIFARQRLGQQFFVQTEYESLNTEYRTNNPDRPISRTWVPGFFAGGGLFQPIGQRAAIIVSALYNLTYDATRSPYNSPWNFNIGFTL